jgi:hypothetical protein
VSGYGDVLAREEAWYLADLANRGLLPLLAASGGPFDVVAANPRRLSQGKRQLWLAHAESNMGRGSKQDTRWDHDLVVLALWSSMQSSVRADDDERTLDLAVQRVIDRIKGPPGDRGHDGRWWAVGPVRVSPASPLLLLTHSDVLGGLGAAYTVAISYRVTEWLAR